jgi:uncharacterized protein (TIGR03086 family)
MSTPRALYLHALDGFDDVVTSVQEDQWDRTSRCPSWTVRELTGHVIDGQRQVTAMLTGERGATPLSDPAGLGRLAGGDPVASWQQAREQTTAALSRVDDGAVLTTPLGDTPLPQLLATAVVEPLLHAWDLSASIGRRCDLDPEAVRVTLAGVAALGDQLAATGMYAAARPMHEGMTAQDQLLALTGRG